MKAFCVPLMWKYGSFSRFVRLRACVTAVSPSWRFVRWVLLIESCLIAGEPKNRASPEQRNQTDPSTQRDLLRLLAEVHFISAEVQTHSFWSDFPSEQHSVNHAWFLPLTSSETIPLSVRMCNQRCTEVKARVMG